MMELKNMAKAIDINQQLIESQNIIRLLTEEKEEYFTDNQDEWFLKFIYGRSEVTCFGWKEDKEFFRHLENEVISYYKNKIKRLEDKTKEL